MHSILSHYSFAVKLIDMELLEHLNWRYATKQFDSAKEVALQDIEKIKDAIRLSASSYGLQLYKVLVIKDLELRQQLKTASWNQPQITDASHLFVFCNYTLVQDNHVDEYLNLAAEARQSSPEAVKEYGRVIKEKIKTLPDSERHHWTVRQTYLALGNLLNACAELKIDSCPMEGFDNNRYNELLNLTEQGLNAAVIAPVGYRSVNDKTQHYPKVRRPAEQLFELI